MYGVYNKGKGGKQWFKALQVHAMLSFGCFVGQASGVFMIQNLPGDL